MGYSIRLARAGSALFRFYLTDFEPESLALPIEMV